MADIKWIKLTISMFDDEKIRIIEGMPEADSLLIIWIKLLTLAGKTNAGGYIFLNENIPYTEEMLANIFNRPLTTVRLALKTFEQFEMIFVDETKKIFIANWDKHQNVESMDKIREQTRKRVAEHRKRQKQKLLEGNVTCNDTVTDGNAIDIEEDIDKEEDKEKDEDIEEDGEGNEENGDTPPPVPYKKIQSLFNEICKSFSKVIKITSKRKPHVEARWEQFKYNIDAFKQVFKKVEASDFCKGHNDRNWKCSFDWLIKNDTNMVKVLEGKYDNDDRLKPPDKNQSFKKTNKFNEGASRISQQYSNEELEKQLGIRK